MLIDLQIPTAAAARDTVKKGKYTKAQQQALKVEAIIKAAIENGRFECGGDGILERPVIVDLESKGYRVTSATQYNEDYWSVSWE